MSDRETTPKRASAAEQVGEGMILCGFIMAAIGTLVAIIEANAIAMVLAGFGWAAAGWAVLRDA